MPLVPCPREKSIKRLAGEKSVFNKCIAGHLRPNSVPSFGRLRWPPGPLSDMAEIEEHHHLFLL